MPPPVLIEGKLEQPLTRRRRVQGDVRASGKTQLEQLHTKCSTDKMYGPGTAIALEKHVCVDGGMQMQTPIA